MECAISAPGAIKRIGRGKLSAKCSTGDKSTRWKCSTGDKCILLAFIVQSLKLYELEDAPYASAHPQDGRQNGSRGLGIGRWQGRPDEKPAVPKKFYMCEMPPPKQPGWRKCRKTPINKGFSRFASLGRFAVPSNGNAENNFRSIYPLTDWRFFWYNLNRDEG